MSRNTPNISASAVHEARMIIQQFLRHRQSMNFWSPTPKPAPVAPSLKCARCLGVSRTYSSMTVEDAITIFEGTATCRRHL